MDAGRRRLLLHVGCRPTLTIPVGGTARPGRGPLPRSRHRSAPSDPVVRPATNDPEKFVGTDVSRDGHWLLAYDISYTQHRRSTTGTQRVPARAWTTLVAGRPGPVLGRRLGRPVLRPDRRWRFPAAGPAGRPGQARHARTGRRSCPRRPTPSSRTRRRRRPAGARPTSATPPARSSSARSTGSRSARSKLPGIGSSSGIVGNPEDDEAFYDFSSFTQPPEIWRTSIATGATGGGRSAKSPSTRSPTPWSRRSTPRRTARRSRCSWSTARTPRRTGRRRSSSTATAASASTSSRPSRPASTPGSRRAAATPWPTSGAAASTARTGTRPVRWPTSRTSSTTSSPPASTW